MERLTTFTRKNGHFFGIIYNFFFSVPHDGDGLGEGVLHGCQGPSLSVPEREGSGKARTRYILKNIAIIESDADPFIFYHNYRQIWSL